MNRAVLEREEITQPAAAALALECVFVVTYHAYPDPAVGAMRMSELAASLAASGVTTHVFARTYDQKPRGSELAQGVTRISLDDPTPWSYRLLGRLLASQRKKGAEESSEKKSDAGAAPPPPPPAPGEERTGWLRFNYYRVTGAMDDQKKWSVSLLRALLGKARQHRPSAIIASGPPFSPLIAATIASRLLGVGLVIDLRDPWVGRPATPPGIDRGLRNWLDLVWERQAMRRAHAVIVTSVKLANTLSTRYPFAAKCIHVIPNGYDERHVLEAPRAAGRLDLLYAGTIYLNRNPLPLLEAIAALVSQAGVSREAVSLTFVGSCNRWRDVDLQQWARERSLTDVVKFLPPVGSADVRRLTEASNVLVNFSQGQPSQVPAKLFEQIAARRPLLLFAEPDSESAATVAGIASVIRVNDDSTEVLRVLEQLYRSLVTERSPATQAAVDIRRFSRANSNERLLRLLDDAARSNT